MGIVSINPATGEEIKVYNELSLDDSFQKLALVNQSWKAWRNSRADERGSLLRNMAAVLRKRKKELAVLMANEMGKPVTQGEAEIEKCAVCCEYYAEYGAQHRADRLVTTEASKSYVSFQPIGMILAVMPWNFPFWQVFRFLAPALSAGNYGVLKHASNVPGCALAIEEIVNQAGFPKNIFSTLLIGAEHVAKIIQHPLVKAVTLTGSTNAGIRVATTAASVLKKTVLELGGSDAYVILVDADLELAAESCVESRLINSGQSCIAGKRFIVEKSIVEEFTALFRKKMQAKRMGDPLDANTDVGPQARADLRDELHSQVLHSIEKGAKCILGGKVPAGDNAFYPPTILTSVTPGMPAYDDELFGPVASIITAEDEQDAIRIANDTVFGLGSAVFTKDIAKGERIAATKLQAGSSYVNHRVLSDPRLPFGGIKTSGYGRELGDFGMHEFMNIKTIYIR
ncbi:succinate-semialdehyde dehydrogenase / glutarate-semialdehyde dehydrogenase [Dyadobacter soli]|uniref:Succinate-semialdehyde dehydrogenase / glutarate-semialdehyde dehydrogenase n=1 Tax=Dyadobacter soli TaxID=659014 RepID=A0A1G7MHW0_9BACT|nr:NAD-dependent succinate-semialdehyde dehydrogenase [Dyadobacter soli]SDF60710.1 succinate-semialdehyde dehydrogenase / glutarate-semialdehyde dehydrogenase [Dyadobacter soli]